jgi:hypothetical protein
MLGMLVLLLLILLPVISLSKLQIFLVFVCVRKMWHSRVIYLYLGVKLPEWVRGDMGVVFEKYVERKWKDALNEAAAEPQGWEASGGKVDKGHMEKPAWGKPSGEKYMGVTKKTVKAVGVANIVTPGAGHKGRKCKFHSYTGSTEGHLAASCNRLQDLDPESKQKALEESGLCAFCSDTSQG